MVLCVSGAAQRAVRHGAPRGTAVRPPELGDGQQHTTHLRHEVDFEPGLRRLAELLILWGQFLNVGDVDDFHALSFFRIRRVPERRAGQWACFL